MQGKFEWVRTPGNNFFAEKFPCVSADTVWSHIWRTLLKNYPGRTAIFVLTGTFEGMLITPQAAARTAAMIIAAALLFLRKTRREIKTLTAFCLSAFLFNHLLIAVTTIVHPIYTHYTDIMAFCVPVLAAAYAVRARRRLNLA
ncbi:MAG: hypothetical protein PHP45_10765 [Elusimicrobiales bacterium]|nr:hypothetical protein [Elusimicrobiales bacterium]